MYINNVSHKAAISIIKQLNDIPDSAFQIPQESLAEIKNNISILQSYYSELQDKYCVLSSILEKSRNTSLRILNDKKIGKQFFLGVEGKTEQEIENIETIIKNMYFLTDTILAQLRLINEPNYSVAYADSESGTYVQAKDGKAILKAHSSLQQRKGAWILKFSASLNQIAQTKRIENKEEYYDAQFDRFSKIIIEHLTKAGQKEYKDGHILEAYEHFRESGVQKMYASTVIKYYWQSTGVSPYYTGPDTKLSQVKNYNATLTSVNTILYTTQTILAFASGTIPTSKQLKEVFTQGDEIAHNKLRKVLESGLEPTLKTFLEKTFSQQLGLPKT